MHTFLSTRHVTIPLLLAAMWSADHNKMAAFNCQWMVLHQYCFTCMVADDIQTCEGSVPRHNMLLCLGATQVVPRDRVQEKSEVKRKFILLTLCRQVVCGLLQKINTQLTNSGIEILITEHKTTLPILFQKSLFSIPAGKSYKCESKLL